MTKKKKVLAKSTTEAAIFTANIDGKWKGLSQKEARATFQKLKKTEAVTIILGQKSVVLEIRREAKVLAQSIIAKMKNQKKRKVGSLK